MIERLVQLPPAFLIDAVNEEVWIVGRLRDKRQNVARGGFDGDQRPPKILECLLDDTLQAHVEREHQIGTRHRIDTAQHPNRPTARGHLDFLHSGLAMQFRFPGLLKTLLPNRVGTAIVAGIPAFFQRRNIGVRDTPDVANHVCG